MDHPPSPWDREHILDAVRRYWGFDQLRPFQEEAIRAGLEHRDSLLVLPTGGGKSLCYQVPPLLTDRTDVVVSPLISLMKDQVDGLRACGYPAAALHSGLSPKERFEAERDIAEGKVRLIFAAPERLLTSSFLNLIRPLGIRSFAIDEAHCISHWGHDFRPEYRRMAGLKERFPGASLHAYTATATHRVRDDIVEQLRLADPNILVGDFDRPNLTYRIEPRDDVYAQTLAAVRRHADQAVIVYCLSRRDTEEMACSLVAQGVRAAHYHAGMNADARRATQDDFANDRIDVVAATVAFGMGIDRSDVRCVVHATMPKSVEHYQQETGRAGRDGLPAECILFYSQSDVIRWESLIRRSAENAERPQDAIASALERLEHMRRFCTVPTCRHRSLVGYFGQTYEPESCQACDRCLKEHDTTVDGTVAAQKILSCVARVQERFGAGHVVDVLRGADTERIKQYRHDSLSTYGLMQDTSAKALRNMVFQLVDQGLLDRTRDEYPILKLNDASWRVLHKEMEVRLIEPRTRKVKRTKAEADSWEGVDRPLFDKLRDLRTRIAGERGVPSYVIAGDVTLRDMARRRPRSKASMLSVHGIGEQKLRTIGGAFMEVIRDHCGDDAPTDDLDDAVLPPPARKRPNRARQQAFELFARGWSLERVGGTIGRAPSTTSQYLVAYIEESKPERIDVWVEPAVYKQVRDLIDEVGSDLLKPIYERLDAAVPYDTIRLVARHRQALRPAEGAGP